MKFCVACKQLKELSEFNKDRQQKDGHRGCCRECTNTKRRSTYRERSKDPNFYSIKKEKKVKV